MKLFLSEHVACSEAFQKKSFPACSDTCQPQHSSSNNKRLVEYYKNHIHLYVKCN